MADKNLHDIKIDELDNKRKTPLKNILTLLALLFIILVISVVITKLILNTDEKEEFDNNITTERTTPESGESPSDSLMGTAGAAIAGATGAAIATTNSATESAKNGANSVADGAKDTAKDVAEDAKATKENLANSAKDTANSVANATKEVKSDAKDTKDAVKDGAKNLDINNALKDQERSTSKTKVPLRDHQPVKAVKELDNAKKNADTKSTTPKSSTTKSHTSSRGSSTKSSSHANAHSDKVIVKRNSSTKKSSSHTSHTSSKGSTVSKLPKGFYIKVGTFSNTTKVIKEIKKTGLNYKLVKTKNGKLTRAYIGRFSSKQSAKTYLNRAKKVSASAFIYEEK